MFICLRNDFLELRCLEIVIFVVYLKFVLKYNFGYIFFDVVYRNK